MLTLIGSLKSDFNQGVDFVHDPDPDRDPDLDLTVCRAGRALLRGCKILVLDEVHSLTLTLTITSRSRSRSPTPSPTPSHGRTRVGL